MTYFYKEACAPCSLPESKTTISSPPQIGTRHLEIPLIWSYILSTLLRLRFLVLSRALFLRVVTDTLSTSQMPSFSLIVSGLSLCRIWPKSLNTLTLLPVLFFSYVKSLCITLYNFDALEIWRDDIDKIDR